MSEMILFKDPERDIKLAKYKYDQTMTRILKHAYRVQDEVNRDIQVWKQPSSGNVSDVIEWLIDRRPQLTRQHPMGFDCRPTAYDYRKHARVYAAQLLFKVADPYWEHLDLIGSTTLGDHWSKTEKVDYWRAVAICSSVWEETS